MALLDITFITASEVKTALDISESTWDTAIEALIDSCTQFCMSYCGRGRFIAKATDETEYYNGGGKKLFLRNFPIKSITSISYRSGDFNSPTWTAFSAATDYVKDDRQGILSFNIVPDGVQNIRIIYKGGYDGASNVPADLKLAVTQAVTKRFSKRKSEGTLSESVGGASVNWNPDWDSELKAILDNYRVFL